MKNRFFKLIVAGVCLFSSVGFLTACDEEPVTPPENNPPEQEQTQENPPAQTTTYTLIFDEDNNPQTTNTTKTIEKTAINNRSTWPTLAEKDGYAGEWVKKSQDGDTITLIANYGDGSAENPYLIGTVQQLENMINSTKSFNEVYTSASYNVTTEANAKRKVVHYNTVDIAYVKDSSSTPSKASWTLLHCVPTNKLHVRLVSDIDVSSFSEASVGGAVSIVFDGAKYDLDGNIIDTYALNKVSASAFSYYYYASKATYSGNMFEMIVDSTFKNLEINLTDTVAGFAFMARDGQTTLENITVNSTESITKGNNSSAFVSHIMSNCDFRFINCTNNADYEGISGSYNGIFVGGYAVYGTSVSFTNCINNGNIVTGGTCGFFFGNSSYKPTNLTVKNCINNGIMIGDQRSHILVPLVDATRNGEDKYNDTNAVVYDTTVEGEFTQNGEFLKLSSTSTVSVSGNDLIISNSSANLTAGTYE
ncbi:MAG: hypothetical protein IJB98_02165, partial [Clostridia bacterium]|nr:hypothetical protein [Clostridia bacterium]